MILLYLKAVQYIGQIGSTSTILAIGVLFFHMSSLAAIIFFMFSIICVFFSLLAILTFLFGDPQGFASLSLELPPGLQDRCEGVIKLFSESSIPELFRDKEKHKVFSQVLVLALKIMMKQLWQKQPPTNKDKHDN
jgi:hypothetical protein